MHRGRQAGHTQLCYVLRLYSLSLLYLLCRYFITKNVLAPIEQIMNVFNDIKATQDYSKRLPKSNSVEMNQLSDEINGLLTHIEDENIQGKRKGKDI